MARSTRSPPTRTAWSSAAAWPTSSACTLGDTLSVLAADGSSRSMRVVGHLPDRQRRLDEEQAFVLLKRAQVAAGPPEPGQPPDHPARRPVRRARASRRRSRRRRATSRVSWIEASEASCASSADPQHHHVQRRRRRSWWSRPSASTTCISTIVMEKTRDIAIMKSMGFHRARPAAASSCSRGWSSASSAAPSARCSARR